MNRPAAITRNEFGTYGLERDRTLKIEPRRAEVIVEAQAGTCLVTQEGDPTDHVVVPGRPFRSRPRGAIALWALTPAIVKLGRGDTA